MTAVWLACERDKALLRCSNFDRTIRSDHCLTRIPSRRVGSEYRHICEITSLSERELLFCTEACAGVPNLARSAHEELVVEEDYDSILSLSLSVKLSEAIEPNDATTGSHQAGPVSQRGSKSALKMQQSESGRMCLDLSFKMVGN
jgi:hypothetical protein